MAEDGDDESPNTRGLVSPDGGKHRARTTDRIAQDIELTKEVLANVEQIKSRIAQLIESGQDAISLAAASEENSLMGSQLERLEQQFDRLSESVTDIKVSLGKIETKLDSTITRGQAAVAALVIGSAIFGAGWWIVQAYLSPILTRLPH